jgi:hypothetical protein
VTHLDKQSQKIAKSKSKNGKIKKVKRTASSNKKQICITKGGSVGNRRVGSANPHELVLTKKKKSIENQK